MNHAEFKSGTCLLWCFVLNVAIILDVNADFKLIQSMNGKLSCLCRKIFVGGLSWESTAGNFWKFLIIKHMFIVVIILLK